MKVGIYDISGTIVVRIPRDYAKDHQLKKIRFVNMREDEQGNLIITPEEVK